MTDPFMPSGDRSDLSAATSSSRIALPGWKTVRVTNTGSVTAYLRFGSSTVTAATATGLDLPAGAVETFRVPVGATHLAGITASGSTTVGVTPGEGA